MDKLLEALNVSGSVYLNAALVLVVFWVLAKAVDLIINKGARRLVRLTKNDTDNRIIDAVHRPVYYTIILAGIVVAMSQVLEHLLPDAKIMFYARGFIYTLMVLIWARTAMAVINALVSGVMRGAQDTTGLGGNIAPLVENTSKVAVFVATVAAGLAVWQVNVVPLLASAGIVGAGVAFAAKDTIANLFGGVSIFLDKPFKVGDYVNIEGGDRGEVVTIGLRSTRIFTRDHVQVIIPNSVIANSKIINESVPDKNFRVRVPVGVAYGSDIKLVQKTLLEIAAANDNVIDRPESRVRFRQFADSSLNFELLCWAKDPSLRGLTAHEINCEIYYRFADLGIQIPFPQRDVHIINSDMDKQ